MFYIESRESKPQCEANSGSYLGGLPFLPEGMTVPVNPDSGVPMVQYFRIGFPEDHLWAEYILVGFCSVDTISEDNLIPNIPSASSLVQIELTRDFFRNYQTFFRFRLFGKAEKCILISDYDTPLLFRPLECTSVEPLDKRPFAKLCDAIWAMENESPATYESEEFHFIVQLIPNYEYRMRPGAKQQRDLSAEMFGIEIKRNFYRYFIGNSVYIFGLENPDADTIYIVTQPDDDNYPTVF